MPSERLGIAPIPCLACIPCASTIAGIKNIAVVFSAGNKYSSVGLADLAKLCKGTQKAWPSGKSFPLVTKDSESPELRVAVQKLLGESGNGAKAAIAKVNESRPTVKIVSSDEDSVRTVEGTAANRRSLRRP